MMVFFLTSIFGGIGLFFVPSSIIFNYLGGIIVLFTYFCVFLNFGEFYTLLFSFFVDSMANSFVFLSSFITLLMLYSSYKIYKTSEFSLVFSSFLYILLFTLIVSFYVSDYLLFYLFFEISLIPTLLIITGWGYQPERLQAGLYFLFYTLFASLPLLLLLVYMMVFIGGLGYLTSIYGSGLSAFMFSEVVVISFFGSLAFLVKLPMFFTHLWLPKAHVEAPVAGSMILAGVLLKLGGYGLMRLSYLGESFYSVLGGYLIGLGLIGMVFVGLMCCRLNDFKALVAYSSVAHMAMVICGVMTFFLWGYEGSLIMMIGHGLSSSGLFCVVNLYYERTGSRSFYMNKGMLLVLPILTLLFFMLSAANMAAPPTINLMSEIFLMAGIMGFEYFMLLVFPIGSFLGAVFTLFMFSYSQHGRVYDSKFSYSNLSVRECHVLLMHIVPVNLLVLNPSLFMEIG